MMSGCANPSCDAKFMYLRQGGLSDFSSDDPSTGLRASRLTARMFCWWLGPGCCSSMELVQEHEDRVTLVPLKSGEQGTSEENSGRTRAAL